MDGDLYMTDEAKEDCHREVQAFISRSVSQYNPEIKITYYLTSIYGETGGREVDWESGEK